MEDPLIYSKRIVNTTLTNDAGLLEHFMNPIRYNSMKGNLKNESGTNWKHSEYDADYLMICYKLY